MIYLLLLSSQFLYLSKRQTSLVSLVSSGSGCFCSHIASLMSFLKCYGYQEVGRRIPSSQEEFEDNGSGSFTCYVLAVLNVEQGFELIVNTSFLGISPEEVKSLNYLM